MADFLAAARALGLDDRARRRSGSGRPRAGAAPRRRHRGRPRQRLRRRAQGNGERSARAGPPRRPRPARPRALEHPERPALPGTSRCCVCSRSPSAASPTRSPRRRHRGGNDPGQEGDRRLRPGRAEGPRPRVPDRPVARRPRLAGGRRRSHHPHDGGRSLARQPQREQLYQGAGAPAAEGGSRAGRYSVYVSAPQEGDWSLILNSDLGIELGALAQGHGFPGSRECRAAPLAPSRGLQHESRARRGRNRGHGGRPRDHETRHRRSPGRSIHDPPRALGLRTA